MRNSLIILGVLEDQDVDWLARVGQVHTLQTGDCLVEEGVHFDFLGIVLEGSLKVTSLADTDKILSMIYPGEILGEVSFLDSRPPLVTLFAQETTQVLKVSRRDLSSKLRTDTDFGSRFYKAIGVCLAQRLNHLTQSTLTAGNIKAAGVEDVSDEEISVVDPDVLEAISLAGRRFEYLIERSGTS